MGENKGSWGGGLVKGSIKHVMIPISFRFQGFAFLLGRLGNEKGDHHCNRFETPCPEFCKV